MEKMNEIVIYQPDEIVNLEVRVENESVWLTLNQIATLFDRDKSVISRHISNIFKEKELSMISTVAKNATVQMENGRSIVRQMDYYNLDVIISVGYRVKSQRGTQFRIWANQVLKEFLLNGYAINSRLTRLEQRMDNKFWSTSGALPIMKSKSDSLFGQLYLQLKACFVMGKSLMRMFSHLI